MRRWALHALAVLLFAGVGIHVALAESPAESPTYTHRYRLTIEVQAEGELKTASSVIQVSAREFESPLQSHPVIENKVQGDAVVVDLGKGRHVIAVLGFGDRGHDGGRHVAIARVALKLPRGERRIEAFETLSKMTGQATLSGEDIPTLVIFQDMNNPLSVRVVPLADLGKVLGPDVFFKRAWIELTADPVTRQIDKKLPWLPGPRFLTGEQYCQVVRDPHCFTGYSFTR
jgi:hypothetical protein